MTDEHEHVCDDGCRSHEDELPPIWPPWKAWEGAPLLINGQVVGRLTKIEIGPIDPSEDVEVLELSVPENSVEVVGLNLPEGTGDDLREWFRRVYTNTGADLEEDSRG